MQNPEIKNKYVLAADIGGTHITVALIDVESKQLVSRSKLRTNVNSKASASMILESWADAFCDVLTKADATVREVGIAMPGPFDYENGVSLMTNMHKYESLYGINIRKVLAEKLNIDEAGILFRNDAEAFLEGEVFCGGAVGYNHAIGITLGTGLGSATSHFGVTKDVNLGSSPFLEGITEDYLSSRWFFKRYYELTGKQIRDVKLLTDAAEPEPVVQQMFIEFNAHLSTFLDRFVSDEGAEVVVIGGGMSGASRFFIDHLTRSLIQRKKRVDIKISTLGEDAALLGAASVFRLHESPQMG